MFSNSPSYATEIASIDYIIRKAWNPMTSLVTTEGVVVLAPQKNDKHRHNILTFGRIVVIKKGGAQFDALWKSCIFV